MGKRLSAREIRLARDLNNGIQLAAAVRHFRVAEQKNINTSEIQNNPYVGAIQSLRRLAIEKNIPIVVIGGVATVYHGYKRNTDDMDVVVSSENFSQIQKVCREYGFELDLEGSNSFGFKLWYGGIKIEVLREGTFTGDIYGLAYIPSPEELGVTHGLQVVSLERWVQLKIAAGRVQDRLDIGKVFSNKDPEQLKAITKYLKKFNKEYAERFQEIVEEAWLEEENERKRLLYMK